MLGILEKKLANYFIRILEGEKSVELLRQNLANKDNFELYAAFKRLDRDNKKFISLNDLKNFFLESKLNFNDFNLREIIRHFDKDSDFVINYQEFCNFILTKNDSNLRCLVTQRQTYSVDSNQYLSEEIEFSMARIFEKELQLIDEFYEIATDIKKFDFNVYQAFRQIDYMNSNQLDENNLSNYLRISGCILNKSEMKSLLSRLDRDWDGKISYEEFKEIFYLTLESETTVINYKNNTQSKFNTNNNVLINHKQTNSNSSQGLHQANTGLQTGQGLNQPNQEFQSSSQEGFNQSNQSHQGMFNQSNQSNQVLQVSSSKEFQSSSQGFNQSNQSSHGFQIQNKGELKEIDYNNLVNNNSNQEDKKDDFKKTNNSNFNTSAMIKNSPTKELYNNSNLINNKVTNFASTMSTIKGYASPLRDSALEDLNIRASMNTYSPSRGAMITNYVSNQSQTQPRTLVKSSYIPNNQFTQKLNYDYNNRNNSTLIRSVDRLNQNKSTAINQSRMTPNLKMTSPNQFNSNTNTKEEFFNQNYRSKIKSISPKKYLDVCKTYTSPRKDNFKLNEQQQDLRKENNTVYNKGFYQSNFSPNVNNPVLKTNSRIEIEPVLAKFFHDLILIETNIEAIKESLSLKTDVKLNSIFQCFDISGKGFVSVPDFKETLNNSLEIYSSIEDIKLLFKRFDQDLDCKLNFNEFCEMLSPKKIEYARIMKERKNYGYESELTLESKLILIKLFRTLIEGENLIENNRQFLTSRPSFSSYDAFDSVKGKYQNFILKENVLKYFIKLNFFLQKHSIFNSQFELDVLFDRFDKNREGRITFNKFIQEILPKSYYSY